MTARKPLFDNVALAWDSGFRYARDAAKQAAQEAGGRAVRDATAPARLARMSRRRKLRAVIVGVRGAGPSEHPWKEAAAILRAVNLKCEAAGVERLRARKGAANVVEVSAIARILKEFTAL
jgi:hypothetical protein